MLHKNEVKACFYSGKYKDALQIIGRRPLQLATSDNRKLALFQLGSMVFIGEFDEARSLFEFAKKNGVLDAEFIIPAQFFLSIGEVRRSHYEKAAQLIAANAWLAKKQFNKSGNIEFYVNQGIAFIHFYRGHFEKSSRFAQKAYLAAFENDFRYGQALALDALGQSLCQMGQVQRGLFELNRGIEIAKSIGNGGLVTALEIGVLRFRSQYGVNGKKAISECQRALKKLDSQNNYSK
ncbi:MAG: hypothetical protein KDD34_05265, partial [Bdellovibrionales bacterium]|nr:hypothetical protein [Bdellovibrionales bacterium]